MREDFDPSFSDENNDNRLVKLEDMFSDSAYYYFDVAEWESMIEYYLSVLKLDKATRALDFAKVQHPSSLELSMKEAELLSEQNKPHTAIILLKKLELTYPFDGEIPLMMGNVHSRFGESYDAIKCFKRALDLADEEIILEIYMQLASECLVLEKPNQAFFWLKQLMDKQPESIEGLYELALLFESENMLDEGIEFYKGFIEHHPYNHHAWFNLGNLYSVKENLQEALRAYDYSVISFEEFSSGWFNKGSILARLDLFEDAIEAFEKTLDLEGPSAHTLCNIGECYEEMGMIEKANLYFERALVQDPYFEDALIGSANCLLELNNIEGAFELCEKGLEFCASRGVFQHVYAETCQALGFFKEAKRAYKKVLKADPDNWEAFIDYSGMQWENGHLEEAVEIIESGLALNHNQAELNYRAGVYWYLLGEKTKAFNRWNNAFVENPLKLEQIFDFCAALKTETEVVEFFEQF